LTRRGGEARAIGQVQDQLPSAGASPCRLATRSQGYCPLLRRAASGNLYAHDQECSWHTSRSLARPDCAGQPVVCADPCNRPAGGQIEYMGAAAECIDPWLGAGVGPLEAPAAREAEGFGATLHEDDHLQGISGDFVAHPEFYAALVRVNRHLKAAGERALADSFLHESREEIERAGGVVRRADVEHTGEVGEVISHVGLQKSQSPAQGPGSVKRKVRGRFRPAGDDHSVATACGSSGSEAVASPALSSSPSARNAGRVSALDSESTSTGWASGVRSGSGTHPAPASNRSASLAMSGFLR